MSTIIRFDPRRSAAVRDVVRARCDALKLCADARQRVMGRAMKLLREGRSAAVACSEAVSLANRLVGARSFRVFSPEPAA